MFNVMKKDAKKYAFTLSEVMVTLAIVGTIATLTIANVGYSIQHKARASEFKTVYAKMEKSLRNIINDSGHAFSCYTCPNTDDIKKYGLNVSSCTTSNTECTNFSDKYLKSLGVIRSCETDPKDEGCIPKNYPFTGIENCFNEDYSSAKAYILDNSLILILEPTNNDFRLFAIDINGKKGPNKWGQDIFTFSVSASETTKIGDNYFASNLTILPPSSCLPGASVNEERKSSTRSSEQMFQEITNYND